MALNNNFGIKIVNRTGNDTVMNGKWPILGFDIDNIKQAFRTTRIVDTSDNQFYDSGNTLPDISSLNFGYGENVKYGTVKKLAAKYEHGYTYAPMGYYTVTGNYVVRSKANLVQNASGTYSSSYGGSYDVSGYNNLSPTDSATGDILYPKMNSFNPNGYGVSQFAYINGVSIGISARNPDLVVPSNNPFYRNYANDGEVNLANPEIASKITVEVDEKYVYIYNNYRWYDTWRRYVFFDGSYDPSLGDVSDRLKIVADTSGSVYEVNVYLTPYNIEEMILNEQ